MVSHDFLHNLYFVVSKVVEQGKRLLCRQLYLHVGIAFFRDEQTAANQMKLEMRQIW